MTKLGEMTYDEFGKLRFLDFFPKIEAYREDHEGGLEAGIGLACWEGYIHTLFASPVDVEWQTAEMNLEFGCDCPEAQGHALLDGLGLELRRGMSAERVKEILCAPEEEDPRSLGFVVGTRWPYYVGCIFDDDHGLCRVSICRKDLADEQARRES